MVFKFKKISNIVLMTLTVMAPLAAIGFTFNYLKQRMRAENRLVQIRFYDATAIVPEKTRIIYKGISVGAVKSVKLSDDHENAMVVALVEENVVPLLRKGSTFKLISAEVSWNGLSGLDTLMSGAYIQFVPGSGEPTREFKGILPDNDKQEQTYSTFRLETDHAESLSLKDSIFHRGVKVGHIKDVKLNQNGNKVLLGVAIYSEYLYLIRTNSVFWKKQGIKADLGLFGSDIRINSLDTLAKGGIEFATPTDFKGRAKSGRKFVLQKDEPETFFKEPGAWAPQLRYRQGPAVNVKSDLVKK